MTASFRSPLVVRELDECSNSGRGLFELVVPLIYESEALGETIIVPAGFKTDFASVPRLPVVWLLFGDTARKAAALHDFLYTKPHNTTREQADQVLREAAQLCGVGIFRATCLYLGVRIGGASHWD